MTYQIMTIEEWRRRAAAEYQRLFRVSDFAADKFAMSLEPSDFPEGTPEEAVSASIRTQAGAL